MSNSKKITIILVNMLAVLAFSGCTMLNQINQLTKNISTPTPRQPQATATEWPTPIPPTPNYSPTPNLDVTRIAAERDNAIEQMAIVNKRLTAVNLELTVNSSDKTQTTANETHEAYIVIATGTQLVIMSTNDQASRNFQVVLPTLVYAGTQSAYSGNIAQSEIGRNWLIGGGAAAIGFAMLIAMVTSRKVAPKVETTNELAAVTTQAETKKNGFAFAPVKKNGMGLYLSPPGNHAHFMLFAEATLSGEKGFAKPDWEGKDSPYNRQTYNVVYNWMWENDFLELMPGGRITYTKDGRGWVENWIERYSPLSPTDILGSISKDIAAEISQTDENQAPESGGGVVLHEEEETEPDENPIQI